MTIVLKRVNNGNRDEIKKIYEDSFPVEEMVPYNKLIEISNDTDHLFYGIYDDDTLVGMNYLIIEKDMLYVLYLAIGKGYQSKGYGKAVITEIKSKYSGYRICLNIEEVHPKFINHDQRMKRRRFYQLLGFESQDYLVTNYEGITFETMSINGDVAYEETKAIFDYLKNLM
ncbi:GNAT family N-acetyltransferase [Paenibacillus wulumuqiensis]|uniref:GNAT family N-acetyltransferase n=1 Tax=Paenibacillus wulumuqiensis TaxID=1567107 RepID=UPI0006191100|nr:GNAT family N-acetyltransferase [Paenibacillus wulumuqiensis]